MPSSAYSSSNSTGGTSGSSSSSASLLNNPKQALLLAEDLSERNVSPSESLTRLSSSRRGSRRSSSSVARICCVHGEKCKVGLREEEQRAQQAQQGQQSVRSTTSGSSQLSSLVNSAQGSSSASEVSDSSGQSEQNELSGYEQVANVVPKLAPEYTDNRRGEILPRGSRSRKERSSGRHKRQQSGPLDLQEERRPSAASQQLQVPAVTLATPRHEDLYENINNFEGADDEPPKPKSGSRPKRRHRSGSSERHDVFSLRSFYLGALDQRQARRRCRQRTNFRLYHQLPSVSQLDSLSANLQLFVVYRTSLGDYCHFPILEQQSEANPPLGPGSCFYVDYGDGDAPKFSSISALVRYYTVYVQLRRNQKGGVDPDVFPWWEAKVAN